MAAATNAALKPAPRDVTLTRSVDAPRDLVFDVWTQPAHLAQWWGPHGFTNPVCEVDLRVDGVLHIVMRGPDGSEHAMWGRFREIDPPRRLVFTSVVNDDDGQLLFEVRNTVTFEERGQGTQVTVRAQVVRETEGAGRYLAGMEIGWTQSLERLAAYAAAQ